MIAKYGESCEWIQPESEIENAETPWKPEVMPEVVHGEIKIAFFTVNNKGLETLAALISGANVTSGGVKGYMAAVNFKPSRSDIVKRSNGEPLTIETIDELNVNGESIMYTIGFTQ